MKTAMQDFIEIMERTMADNRTDIIIARSIKAHINLAKGLLEKEKDQISNAFNYAIKMRFGSESQINTGKDYYEEVYLTP